MRKVIVSLLLCLLCGVQAVKAQAADNSVKCTGKIGPYDITMFIDPSVEDGYAGYYFYNERPKTRFTLKVQDYETLYKDDAMGMPTAWGFRMKIFEYTPKGNHTGTFEGIFYNNGDQFTGTFTNRKGEEFKFQLTQIYEE